ncbi:MAG: WD40 repeat domain-containing protein, partial [Candidatus Electrothrix sp. AX5]|nr:WD40 repeat domain-containing protein [Candidatus Electrothrix sp. AX5]
TEEERTGSPDAYALMHDYLVGAVELATGDVSTKTEEANQLLRYYLVQQSGVIPLRRLRFIRAHADRPLLRQPNTRRLFRKSLIAPALVLGAMVFVAVLMAGGLYLAATAQIQWREKVIGRYWQNGGAKMVKVNHEILPKKRIVVSGIFSLRIKREELPSAITTLQLALSKRHIIFFDAKTGRTIFTLKDFDPVHDLFINKKNTLILLTGVSNRKDEYCTLIFLDKNKTIDLPAEENCKFSKSEQYIICSSSHEDKTEQKDSDSSVRIAIWSIKKRKTCREFIVKNPYYSYGNGGFFSADGDWLIAAVRKEERKVFAFYNAVSDEKINYLTDNDKEGINFELNSLTKIVCTLSETQDGNNMLQLWNLNDGSLIKERKISSNYIDLCG